jgi:transposase
LKSHRYQLYACSKSYFAVSYLEMTHDEIENSVTEAREVLGSASVGRLERMLSKLIEVVLFLRIELQRKNDELHQLRTTQFGSKTEGIEQADHFIKHSNEPIPPNDDPVVESNNEAKPKMGSLEASILELEPNGIINDADSLQKAAALRAEARRLEAQARGKKTRTKKQPKPNPDDIVRHPIPNDIETLCPICLGGIEDRGKAHEAWEIDLVETKIINRLHLLHQGSCPCGLLNFSMPAPIRGVEQTIFSPGFVANLIYNKFIMHLPLYRQAMDMLTNGVDITRGRLTRLLTSSYLNLKPLIERIKEINQIQAYQQCDESPITMVIDGERSKHFLWCLVTSKAVTYSITTHRNHDTARNVIGGTTAGSLVTDCLGIYKKLFDNKDGSGCMAHLRRKFWYSLPNFPNESIVVLRLIRDLYKIERKCDDKPPETRLKIRREHSLPILEQLKSSLILMNPPPRSALGMAIAYALKHWQVLTYFSRNGNVPIDNNLTEGFLRGPKLGWKNFLFCQSDLGGEAAAGMYTLVTTCKLHGIDIKTYLTDVITKLNSGHKAKNLDELLPWNWTSSVVKQAKNSSIRTEQISANNIIQLPRFKNKLSALKSLAQ